MTPQKKLSVHPQLIANNLVSSPASKTHGGRNTQRLESHDRMVYKYQYYYYYTMHFTMHNNNYLHVVTDVHYTSQYKQNEMFSPREMVIE